MRTRHVFLLKIVKPSDKSNSSFLEFLSDGKKIAARDIDFDLKAR